MEKEVKNHYNMSLLQNPRRIMDENMNIREMYNQPERSKREDSLLRELLESSPGKLDTSVNAEVPLVWDKDLNFIGHKVLEEMRCSELYGNIERDK